MVFLQKGQLGHGDKIPRNSPTVVSEFELSPVQCLITDVKDVACGTDFTVWLTSLEGASIQTAGHPQYGQLGHGTDNEYNAKESSVRLAYEAQPRPTAIASLSDETILKVACGQNQNRCNKIERLLLLQLLGIKEQMRKWSPRRVEIFTKHNLIPPDAIISAGYASSACTAGSFHHFVGAESSCISWGNAQSGQLGYGPNQQNCAWWLAHSLVVVDRSNVGDQLDQLDIYDGKDTDEGIKEPGSQPATSKKTTRNSAAKTSDNANKRKKKTKESSESEVIEESHETENDSDEELGSQPARSKKTTRNSAAKTSDSANKRKRKTKESSESEVIEESHETENDSDEKTRGRNKQRRGKTSSRGHSSATTKVATPPRRGRSRTKT
ncbi:protein RCC2 [Tanacetum coccineum]